MRSTQKKILERGAGEEATASRGFAAHSHVLSRLARSLRVLLHNDSKQQFLALHRVASLLQHCSEWFQHCSNIATLCCAKNRRCESFRVI